MVEPKRLWVVAGAIAVLALVIIALKHHYDTMEMSWSLVTPPQVVEVVTKMDELRNEGRFDESIQLGLRSVSGHSGDDFIYQMVAVTYFVRALHDKDQSGKWTKLGAEYEQKALDANPNDLANVFNAGMNFTVAGDDLDTGGCEYYRKAQTVFQSLAPRLQGERAETQGRAVRLGPFRKQNQEQLSRVAESLRHCATS
jgi:hypothetical protein